MQYRLVELGGLEVAADADAVEMAVDAERDHAIPVHESADGKQIFVVHHRLPTSTYRHYLLRGGKWRRGRDSNPSAASSLSRTLGTVKGRKMRHVWQPCDNLKFKCGCLLARIPDVHGFNRLACLIDTISSSQTSPGTPAPYGLDWDRHPSLRFIGTDFQISPQQN
jgi:hypothetical protein